MQCGFGAKKITPLIYMFFIYETENNTEKTKQFFFMREKKIAILFCNSVNKLYLRGKKNSS